MKLNRTIRITLFLIGFALAMAFIPLLWGQATNTPPTPPIPGADPSNPLSPLKLIIIPVVTALTQFLRKILPKVPLELWPLLTPVFGVLLDWGLSKAGLWQGSTITGMLAGAAGTWFHQGGKQLVDLTKGGPTYEEKPAEKA